MSLTDLKPYTNYTATIELRLSEGVMYSDPVSVTFNTDMDSEYTNTYSTQIYTHIIILNWI